MAEFEVVIDEKRCKGCGICVEVCPKDCLEIQDKYNQAGYFYPEMKPDTKCTGCGACVKLCGDYAISVYEILEKTA
jgi:2-oxoglutarate ferredoxin oxidoreductase subunit delta